MARTTGPLLSFGASGAIAQTQVYSTWRGIPYARRYVKPANPKTVDQEKTRNAFKWANASWLFLPAIAKEPWMAYARGRPFTDRNGWVSRCVAMLRDETTLALLEGSPGVAGGLPATAIAFTPGATKITVAATTPDVPSGWALTSLQAVCFEDQNPETQFVGKVFAAEDAVTPYSLDFNGLTTGKQYAVSAWLKWDRGGGKIAYSISQTGLATPT